jgi:hypothetical protein
VADSFIGGGNLRKPPTLLQVADKPSNFNISYILLVFLLSNCFQLFGFPIFVCAGARVAQ